MRKFVVGDIHGEYEKLVDVLRKANFDYENDRLVSLGDVVDRGYDTYKCVEELLKIKNLVKVRGNHDQCFTNSVKTGEKNVLYGQGGRETMLSYMRETECDGNPSKIPFEHAKFFFTQVDYFVDEDNNLFVHGGFNRHELIETQAQSTLLWDRDLFLAALSYEAMKDHTHKFKMKDRFKHVYVGHTPTIYWGSDLPIKAANITNMDTGCGKGDYPLSLMNTETRELFQSFKSKE